MKTRGHITGWGKYLPEKVYENKEFESYLDTSDDWIFSRTGIKSRRIVGAEESTATMAATAAKKALAVAGLNPNELNLVIVATNTPEYLAPASAALVQHYIGAGNAAAFDIGAGCSGFVYALATAYQFVTSGGYRNILVVGSETMSRVLNWQDRSTCVLFGDGAAALVVQAGGEGSDCLSWVLGNDGSAAEMVNIPTLCRPQPQIALNGNFYVHMEGSKLFKYAVGRIADVTRQAVAEAGLELSDVELFVPHQANARIIRAASESVGIPDERIFMNLEKYGNISAASPAIALCEAIEQNRVKKGDHLVMVAFGAGISWGAAVLEWQH